MVSRALVLLALPALLALAQASPARAQGTPPDQVTLTNGGMLRGTIIENIPGDHVTIQLPTGETRRFAAAEVSAAGPATQPVMQAPVVPPPPAQPQLPPPPAYGQAPVLQQPSGLVLHITGNRPRITLHREIGSSLVSVWTGRGYGMGVVESFEPMCTAPCDLQVPAGTYELGVSEGDGRPQRADHAMHQFTQGTSLLLEYESREALRIGGWVLFGASTLGYLVATLAAAGDSNWEAIFGISTLVYLVLLIPELVLVSFRDHADVRELGPNGLAI